MLNRSKMMGVLQKISELFQKNCVPKAICSHPTMHVHERNFPVRYYNIYSVICTAATAAKRCSSIAVDWLDVNRILFHNLVFYYKNKKYVFRVVKPFGLKKRHVLEEYIASIFRVEEQATSKK